jgi:hypothetical protein
MTRFSNSRRRPTRLRAASAAVVLALIAGCNADPNGFVSATAPAADSLGNPADTASFPDSAAGDTLVLSAAATLLDKRSDSPGIVFGAVNMDVSRLNSVYTGSQYGGSLDPSNILSILSAARAKGARVVIKLCKGKDSYVKNADGTFSLSKWKTLVDRYTRVNLGPYIADGTIVGHYLIDEPQRASRWGGKVISPSTLEAMAKYSKQRWPGMTTFVRAVPTWLAGSSVTYTYLDAGWAQYAANKGDVTKWISAEVAAAKRKKLGLAVGLNVLDGGNGSSKIRGYSSGKYAMSANELKTYGSALLGQSYGCAFYTWMYDGTYYGRTDIKSAMAALSRTAKAHQQTGCRQ